MLAFFLDHFLQYEFVPVGEPWYHGNVWGNVVAVLPLAVLALVGWLWHREAVGEAHRKLDALAAAHERHAALLKAILDSVDPETDGGLQVVLDRLDTRTPGGLREILDRLDGRPPVH